MISISSNKLINTHQIRLKADKLNINHLEEYFDKQKKIEQATLRPSGIYLENYSNTMGKYLEVVKTNCVAYYEINEAGLIGEICLGEEKDGDIILSQIKFYEITIFALFRKVNKGSG